MTKPELQKDSKNEKFTEGVDYYFENGLMVLTEHFLSKRGYCCSNGCRHCPYDEENQSKKVSISSFVS
jgi:hypothetical protein